MLSPDGIASNTPYAHLPSHNKVIVLSAILNELKKAYEQKYEESQDKCSHYCIDQLIKEDIGLHDAITGRFSGVHKFLKQIGIAPTVGFKSPEGNQYDHENEYKVDKILREYFGVEYEMIVVSQVRIASLIIGFEGAHSFDFVIGKNKVIEVAGFNQGSNYISDMASKYLARMDFKEKLAKENNLDFLVIYPCDIHNENTDQLKHKIEFFLSSDTIEHTPYKSDRNARGTFNREKVVQACLNAGSGGVMPRKCELAVYFDNTEMAKGCYSAMKQIGISKLRNELGLLPAIGSRGMWCNHYQASLLIDWLLEVFGGFLPSTTDARYIMSVSAFIDAKGTVLSDVERKSLAPRSARYACKPDICPPKQIEPYLKAGYQDSLKSMTNPEGDDFSVLNFKAFPEKLILKTRNKERVIPVNTCVSGVKWYCARLGVRGGEIVHAMHAVGPGLQKAYSVKKYGLWTAYCHAYACLQSQGLDKQLDECCIVERFVQFVDNLRQLEVVIEEVQFKEVISRALVELLSDESLPDQVLKGLESGEIQC